MLELVQAPVQGFAKVVRFKLASMTACEDVEAFIRCSLQALNHPFLLQSWHEITHLVEDVTVYAALPIHDIDTIIIAVIIDL